MHLREEQIAAFASGALSPEEMQPLELHLQTCGDCLRLVGLAARGASRPTASPEPRTINARYVVREELGSGSMGTVFLAYDTLLDRRVALKRIKGVPTEERRRRLQREAQVMAQLEHPHLAAIYDIGSDAEGDYIALQLVEGPSLRQWLGEKPRSVDEVLDLFIGCGEGLAAAHAAGITHRDFKPENVLVGKDGRARVTDFGLARYLVPESPGGSADSDGPVAESLTSAGMLVGTPLYMSPEQLHGSSDTDGRSDQFSFCIALFEALTGARPFEGRSIDELRRAISQGAPTSGARGRRIPSWLRPVLLRGLSTDAEERYPSMEALVAAIQRRRRARRTLSRAVWALGVVAVLSVAWVAAKRVPVERCATPPPRWSSLWSEPVRQQVSAAFANTKLPFAKTAFQAVDDALAQFVRTWQTQRREACVQAYGTGAHTKALLDRQLACLDRRLVDAEALTRLFQSADESVVSRAPQAVSASLTLGVCEDPPAWMTQLPDGSGARSDHAEKVSELRALRSAGTPAAFLEKSRALEDSYAASPALKDSAEHAEVLTLLAQAQQDAGHIEDARRGFLQAVEVADRAGAEDLRAEAELALAWTHVLAADRKAAHDSLDRAVALLQRIPESLPVRLERLRLEAAWALAAGQAEDAIRIGRDRVQQAERGYGAGSLAATQTRAELAMTLAKAGVLDDARAELLEVVAELEKILGPDHPSLGIHLRKLSEVELHLARGADSLAHARRALAILDSRLGTSPLEVAGAQYLVAVGEAERKSPPSVVTPAFERARELLTRALGPAHPQVALVLFDEARYWALQGDSSRAEPLFTQACGMYAQTLSEDALYTADCWGTEGESLLDLGETQKAGPILEKARQHFEKLGAMNSLEGLGLRAAIARWRAARGDAPRAVRELAQVLRDLETLPSHPDAYREAFRKDLDDALARIPPSRRKRWIRLAGETAPVKAAPSTH